MYRHTVTNCNNWEEVPEAPYTLVKDNLSHLINLPVIWLPPHYEIYHPVFQGVVFVEPQQTSRDTEFLVIRNTPIALKAYYVDTGYYLYCRNIFKIPQQLLPALQIR
jgi:hypothetical protein